MHFNIYLSENTKTLVKLSSSLTNIIYFPETTKHPTKLVQDLFINNVFDLQEVNNIITHSRTLLNYFGHLISEKQLDNKDVKVFIVKEHKQLLYFKYGKYDNEGYIAKHLFNFLGLDWELLNNPIINI